MKSQEPINFWGIGAQKAGTSWLYYNLSKTPGFAIPPVKEFHYFDRDTKYPSPNFLSKTKVKDRIGSAAYLKKAARSIGSSLVKGKMKHVAFSFKWFFSDYSDEWYKSIFAPFKGLKGEITPSYSMLSKEDISRMYAMAPNAKLVLMLRNPIDRAWSHFRHTKKRIEGFTLDNFEESEILAFMKSDGQVLRSDYVRTIENFTSIFPKEQLLIGFFDAIVEAPEQLLEEVIQFISTSNDAEEALNKSWNADEAATKKVVNKSIELDCPPAVLALLKDMYHDMILDLANQYGGYFNKWYLESYGKPSENQDDRLFCTTMIK
ncbi:sulfotransferase domain-containing protein [Flagellimonas flava]|uniref:sulfotransferase domain-containing protein n=1 Tax=Flagellimonas flava TaxID=570519 RepID=UPI003D647909